jgi:hypothetical protein
MIRFRYEYTDSGRSILKVHGEDVDEMALRDRKQPAIQVNNLR